MKKIITVLLSALLCTVLGGNVYGYTACYIYNDFVNMADSYKSLLEANDIPAELIALSSVSATEFSSYKLIIVGSDTGHFTRWWGSLKAINAIRYSGLPILGNGEGGSAFFGKLGLSMGPLYCQHGRSKSIYVLDPEHPIFNEPNNISIGSDRMLDLYTSNSDDVQVYLPVPPPDVTVLSRQWNWETNDQINHLLVLQKGRYMLWGFSASPDMMTQTGKDLYINVVSYLIANAPPITAPEQPQTIHIPDDYPTIQDGINEAWPGDVVLVSDGIYTGDGNVNLDFYGKAITVKSENGPENCIIDCEYMRYTRGFHFHSGENLDSILDGFTIRHGKEDGAGIACYDGSSPTVTNNIITENIANSGGGIICFDNSSPVIRNNIISRNSADNSGGGIDCVVSSPTIASNIIMGNYAGEGGGIHCELSSSPKIISNIIANNWAGLDSGGISCWNSSPMIINNTITGNMVRAARFGGGGISCVNGSSLTIANTILWNDDLHEIVFDNFSSNNVVTISYSNVQGGTDGIVSNDSTVKWLEGNIDEDPLFISAFDSDYHLSNSSPCIGAGTMDGAPTEDIEGNLRPYPPGSHPDIGACENILGAIITTVVEPAGKISATWGSIKAKQGANGTVR